MATKKYVWKFDLEEYLMTKDVKEDFAAKVKPIQTFYMADVARLIAEERTEYRIDTIVNITKLVEAKIRQLACGNNIVVTDNVQYSPGILGLFLGKTGVVDPAKNKAVINMIATAALRAETDQVALEFSGVVRDMGGANISGERRHHGQDRRNRHPRRHPRCHRLEDTQCQCRRHGAGLAHAGQHHRPERGRHHHAAGYQRSQTTDVQHSCRPGKGSYQLTLETWFSTNSTQLKQSRTLTYAIPLVVGRHERRR